MFDIYVQDGKKDSGSMGRLFGSWDAYRLNILSLLERRLAHIARSEFDPSMCIPQVIVSCWTEHPRNGHKLIDTM
jgi:hypothetical protein